MMKQAVFSELPMPETWEICDRYFEPGTLWSSQDIEIVKEARNRRVYRSSDLFIKVFRLGSLVMKLRNHGKKEWIMAQSLHSHGLTASPVAYGRIGEWSYFVAREVPGPTLASFLNSSWPILNHKDKGKVIYSFSQFIVGLSQAGLFQPDFHLNNVMYNQWKNQFFLIDLHSGHRYLRPLNLKERVEQLSYILPPLWGNISPRDMLTFVSMLSREWPELRDRSLRYKVQEKAFWRMRRHCSKRGLRRVKKSLSKINVGKKVIFLSAGTPEEVRHFLHNILNETMKDKKTILKNSRHTLSLLVKVAATTYFLKIYRNSSHFKSCLDLFRTSRAERAWNTSWNLIVRQISTPPPLAALDTKNPWNEIYGAVVHPQIGAGKENIEMIKRTLKNPCTAPVFLSKLCGFVWEMHEKGVFHGDCKITNFYFDPRSPAPFTVFDLDGTKIKTRLSDNERLSDLVNLCASLEWWQIRENLTEEVLNLYTSRHITWREKKHRLLKKLQIKVLRRLERKKNREIQKSDTQ